jgi:hypothetical protein
MQFKLITNDDGTKEIHHRNESGVPFSMIALGAVDTPTDPQALFVWMTEKLKEVGAVPAITQFTLNLP